MQLVWEVTDKYNYLSHEVVKLTILIYSEKHLKDIKIIFHL